MVFVGWPVALTAASVARGIHSSSDGALKAFAHMCAQDVLFIYISLQDDDNGDTVLALLSSMRGKQIIGTSCSPGTLKLLKPVPVPGNPQSCDVSPANSCAAFFTGCSRTSRAPQKLDAGVGGATNHRTCSACWMIKQHCVTKFAEQVCCFFLLLKAALSFPTRHLLVVRAQSGNSTPRPFRNFESPGRVITNPLCQATHQKKVWSFKHPGSTIPGRASFAGDRRWAHPT